MIDPDGNSVSVKKIELETGTLPSFIIPISNGLKISPAIMKNVGSYIIKLTISDNFFSPTYTFNLNVTN
jgi:hypothetical protein